MPIEAIVFFAGATGLLTFAGFIGYAIGYAACQRAWQRSDERRWAWETREPTSAQLAADYAAWKASH